MSGLNVSGTNPGLNTSTSIQTQAVMGVPGSSSSSGVAGLFNQICFANLGTGTTNDWTPVATGTNAWIGGVSNFLQITPSGTPTLNGINTSGMSAGFTFILYNTSTTITINIGNLTGSFTQNQFSVGGAGTGTLGPQYGALCVFDGINIKFPG